MHNSVDRPGAHDAPRGALPALNMLRWLELKVPPPVVGLLIAFVMWGACGGNVASAAPEFVRLTMAGVLAAVGACFDVAGLIAFRREQTTINPMAPRKTSSIVTCGVYKVTRNPMYVGLVFFLCAWAAYLWSWWALAGPAAFVVYISRFQIAPEEKALSTLFGAEYLAYQANVRRWF